MKLNWATGLVFVLATAEAVGASNWFSKAGKSLTVAAPDANSSEAELLSQLSWISWLTQVTAYNKWHETELERWLSDHGMFEIVNEQLMNTD